MDIAHFTPVNMRASAKKLLWLYFPSYDMYRAFP